MNTRLKEQYTKIVQSKQIILLTVAGSELIGLKNGDKSDRDEIGVYIEDMREVAGFGTEQHVVWRSAEARTGKSGEPSKAGDIDLTLYGLRKFLRLALSGNPTILNTFYAPKESCSILTDVGRELQTLAPDIVSRRAGNAFLGYLNQQRLRMLGERGQMNVNRQELVEAHGYDTKYAMHMMRLAYQGLELLEEGTLTLPMPEGQLNYLREIRDGEFSQWTVLNDAQEMERRIKDLLNTSTLSENPNIEKVEDWLLHVYKNFWGEVK